MAAVVTLVDDPEKYGALDVRIVTIALDASYPTNGEVLSLDELDLSSIVFGLFEPAGGYVFRLDVANKKLVAYYGDNNNASDGPLIEVPNTTDLSALTAVKGIIWGRV